MCLNDFPALFLLAKTVYVQRQAQTAEIFGITVSTFYVQLKETEFRFDPPRDTLIKNKPALTS